MAKYVEVEVYSEATNHWIVRTPGREFPAMVIQGDTCHALYVDLRDLVDHIAAMSHIDPKAAMKLQTSLSRYASVF